MVIDAFTEALSLITSGDSDLYEILALSVQVSLIEQQSCVEGCYRQTSCLHQQRKSKRLQRGSFSF